MLAQQAGIRLSRSRNLPTPIKSLPTIREPLDQPACWTLAQSTRKLNQESWDCLSWLHYLSFHVSGCQRGCVYGDFRQVFGFTGRICSQPKFANSFLDCLNQVTDE